MNRKPFNFNDLQHDCHIETGCYTLDGRTLGARVTVPPELYDRYPYNASAYAFLQELRAAIHQYGTIEFPDLPVNRCNHTVAMRHPYEHGYSDNPYLTRFCQDPHQDTPPYPTAFWLGQPRNYSATWVMSDRGLQDYLDHARQNPDQSTEEIHQQLLPRALGDKSALLLNYDPGLLLIDNSEHQRLYHCRSSRFEAMAQNPDHAVDAPMYSYNEIGLLNYIDVLDSRRGEGHRDAADLAAVKQFMDGESL